MSIEFDETLNMNDADFAERFRKAIGAKPGDMIEIMMPQFTRTDGVIPTIPEAFSSLRKCSRADLNALGCCPWDEPENGTVLMLFPGEWYPHIPAGYEMEGISGEIELFEPGETDDDIRFGMLAYGIRVPA